MPRQSLKSGARLMLGQCIGISLESETMWVLLVLDFTEEGPLFVSEACFPVLPPSRRFLSLGAAAWGLRSSDVGNFLLALFNAFSYSLVTPMCYNISPDFLSHYKGVFLCSCLFKLMFLWDDEY